jgi:hypothetical protein
MLHRIGIGIGTSGRLLSHSPGAAKRPQTRIIQTAFLTTFWEKRIQNLFRKKKIQNLFIALLASPFVLGAVLPFRPSKGTKTWCQHLNPTTTGQGSYLIRRWPCIIRHRPTLEKKS